MQLGRVSIVICAIASTASADVRPVQRWSFGISGELHASKVSGLGESGYGPQVELAFGHRRLQYFLEGGVSHTQLGPEDTYMSGGRWRAGVGARWIAHAFDLDPKAATELGLEAFAGVQRFEWDDGGELERPEAGFGIGLQQRVFTHDRQVVFRATARAVFSSVDRAAVTAVCRGSCSMPANESNTGLTLVVGMQW
jgi:hypothetical protein